MLDFYFHRWGDRSLACCQTRHWEVLADVKRLNVVINGAVSFDWRWRVQSVEIESNGVVKAMDTIELKFLLKLWALLTPGLV